VYAAAVEPFAIEDVPAPLARWLPRGASLEFPAQGMTSVVAFVEPGDVVLKRCVDPRYRGWLRREHEVLVALAETSLPVPRVLDWHDAGDDAWLVMTRLPGRQCAQVLYEGDASLRCELLRVVGAAIRRLHDTRVPVGLTSDAPWIDRRLAAARANLEWCDGDLALLEQLEASRPGAVAATLVHGDLNLENVLVADGAVSGFVDWAGGDCGDPRYDLALALQDDEELRMDGEMLAAFSAGYGREIGERGWFERLYEFF
jgi:aminoglycoside phosphotransferase